MPRREAGASGTRALNLGFQTGVGMDDARTDGGRRTV